MRVMYHVTQSSLPAKDCTVNITLMCYYKCFFLLHYHPTGKVEMQQLMTLTELLQYHVSGKWLFACNSLIC